MIPPLFRKAAAWPAGSSCRIEDNEYGRTVMSEMNKANDGARTATALTATALKASLVAALALWAGPVRAGPPPSTPAVTVSACLFGTGTHVHSFNSNDTALLASFETSPVVAANADGTPQTVTLHCATSDGCQIGFNSDDTNAIHKTPSSSGLSGAGLVPRNSNVEIDVTGFIPDGATTGFTTFKSSSPPSKCRNFPK